MRLTEDVIDFSIAEKKTDTAERYIRVDLDTISRKLVYWLFPNGITQKQKDDYIKLKSATQKFKTKPLTVTYDYEEHGNYAEVINYNQQTE